MERAARRLQNGARRTARGLIRRLLRPERRLAAEVELAALERVVVVRQDRRLGNLVYLTSLLAGLRRSAPHASIRVVVPVGLGAVLDPHPDADELVQVDHRDLLRRPWRAAALRARLAAGGPELAIDASPAHRSSFLNGFATWSTGARWRLGYDRPDADLFLNLLAPPPGAGTEAVHESIQLHDLLGALRADLPPAPLPRIIAPAAAVQAARASFRRWGIPGGAPVVGLHPGGRRGKRWAIERFETVAASLAARGIPVVVFSGPAERALLDAMAPPGRRRLYAPPLGVAGLRAHLAALAVFVGGDSGPLHLAAALQVPCVAIFRVADQARYGPRGPGHRVLERGGGEVEPAEVVGAVLESIGGGRPRPPQSAR